MISLYYSAAILLTVTDAFAPRNNPPRFALAPQMVLDPVSTFSSLDTLAASFVGSITEMEVGAALVGAAAGAMSQLPRIQVLQEELSAARAVLNKTEAELTNNILMLEDKLFVMDKEYEEQTARFKRQYDATQKVELEKLKEKLKREMGYKLEIQLAERESQRLIEKVDDEHSRTNRQEELSGLRLKQDRLAAMNAELENALKQSESELTKIRGAVKRKLFVLF